MSKRINLPGTLPALLDSLDPDPRVRGLQFEPLAGWFLQNSPDYRGDIRRVWAWDDWPGRWGSDAGIDLVAETHNGELWAVQVKAYAEATTVTKADVDTFLSESARKVFAYRLLVTTTDRIGKTAQRTIDAQEKPVGVIARSDLLAAELTWPTSPTDLAPVDRPAPAVPRDYQVEAIGDVLDGFAGGDRGQLIMACGTGKTLTAQFIAGKFGSRRTLVLVPSLSLLKQTIRVWHTSTEEPFEILAVCSDDTAAAADDTGITRVSELGRPVTTDPAEIARFLRKRTGGPRVVFCTYQSSPQIAQAYAAGMVPAFDLVIADEAHRCAGPVTSDFATVLDTDQIKARRRLFMTATPKFFTGRAIRAAKESDLEVATMDDPQVFGPVFHRLGFAEAIERKLLTDYQVVVMGVTNAECMELATAGTLVTRDGKDITDARSLAAQVGLTKAIKKYDLKRLITFHSRVAGSRRFAQALPGTIEWMSAADRPTGALWTAYASGSMSAGRRHTLLRQLGDLEGADRGLLANARCLSEGVDVPTLDGVAFIDPRASEVDIVQAVGRAIRRSPDKTVGTIVIPVFLDDTATAEGALSTSEFKTVWGVIKALRAHDDTLAEQIDGLRRELGRRGNVPRLPDRVHFDVPTGIGAGFVDAFDTRLVEMTSAPWEFWFGLLEQYVEEHGTAQGAGDRRGAGRRLGSWIGTQRNEQAHGTLDPARCQRLEQLPGWAWARNFDEVWEQYFALLMEYVAETGTARIPKRQMFRGQHLGGWTQHQRKAYTEGQIPSERAQRLSELPGWVWHVYGAAWERGFARLMAYVDEHGHARVPAGTVVDGHQLGNWVATQRTARGKLPEEKRFRLERLPGWVWDTLEAKWEDGYRHAQRYAEEQGHTRVPKAYVDVDGFQLGQWVTVRRTQFKQGKLDPVRIARLQELPGWAWNVEEARWEVCFEHLRRLAEATGSVTVPRECVVDGRPLHLWVWGNRKRFATLGPERQERLRNLPGWDNFSNDERWETGFRHLMAYVDAHGTACVRGGATLQGYRIGSWVTNQRSKYTQGRLSSEQVFRLEALPGWTWNTPDARWGESYGRLTAYVADQGEVPSTEYVDPDGHHLGSWVANQRSIHKKGQLSQARVERLEALPEWSWDRGVDKWLSSYSMLAEYLRTHGEPPSTKYVTDEGYSLGSWAGDQRKRYRSGQLSPTQTTKLEALPGWPWDGPDPVVEWGNVYHRLAEHGRVHGELPSTKFVAVDGLRLGGWILKQRARYRTGRLSSEQEQRLEALPGWRWREHADAWEHTYAQLVHYLETHKAPPPLGHVTDEGLRLGAWVGQQRAKYKNGKLLQHRAARLEATPGWVWGVQGTIRETTWEDNYERLARYIDAHRGTPPAKYVENDGRHLGSWVAHQRAAARRGELDAEKLAKLEALPGWEIDPFTAGWEAAYSRVVQYLEAHGKLPSTHYVADDGCHVGGWIVSQRGAARRGELDAEKWAKLEALPGWEIDPLTAEWEAAYSRVVQYLEAHGKLPSTNCVDDDGYHVGKWVVYQRGSARRGKLDAEKWAKLDALPGWEWNPPRRGGGGRRRQ